MTWQAFLTDARIAVALIGLVGLIIKALIDFHGSRPVADKISVETFGEMGEQIDRLEGKVAKLREDNDKLRDRVDALCVETREKDRQINDLKQSFRVLELETIEKDKQINEMKEAFKALLKWLEENKITLPDNLRPGAHLFETDPRMKAIRKGAKGPG